MENTESGVPLTPLEPATPVHPHLFKLEVETKLYAAYCLKEVPIPDDLPYGGPDHPLDPGFEYSGELEPEPEPLSDEGAQGSEPPTEPGEPKGDEVIENPTTMWQPVIFDFDPIPENLLKRLSKIFQHPEHKFPIYIGIVKTTSFLKGFGEAENNPIQTVTEEDAPTSAFFRNSCDDLWQPGVFNGGILKQTTPISDEPRVTYIDEATNNSFLQATPFTKESAFLEGTNITSLVTVKPFDPDQGLPPLSGNPEEPEEPEPPTTSNTTRGNSELASRIQDYPFQGRPLGIEFYY